MVSWVGGLAPRPFFSCTGALGPGPAIAKVAQDNARVAQDTGV